MATTRWVLHDPITDETWTMPINPNAMTPIIKRRDVRHTASRWGTLTQQMPRREEALEWSGVIRSQTHYDELVTWAMKRNAVEVTDHVGRTFRIYITDFEPTDRAPIPRAPKRWRYTMKSKLLAGPL